MTKRREGSFSGNAKFSCQVANPYLNFEHKVSWKSVVSLLWSTVASTEYDCTSIRPASLHSQERSRSSLIEFPAKYILCSVKATNWEHGEDRWSQWVSKRKDEVIHGATCPPIAKAIVPGVRKGKLDTGWSLKIVRGRDRFRSLERLLWTANFNLIAQSVTVQQGCLGDD